MYRNTGNLSVLFLAINNELKHCVINTRYTNVSNLCEMDAYVGIDGSLHRKVSERQQFLNM
jgi:hypothetical protein